MSTGINIRPASNDDVDFMVECNQRLGTETEDKTLDAATLRAGIERGLASPELCRYFIAMADGKPVGTTMITYELTDWRDGLIWWLQSVYVLPEFRQQGVFRALYRHIESLAHADPHARALRLYVRVDNERARNTYQAMGMSPSGYEVFEDDWSHG